MNKVTPLTTVTATATAEEISSSESKERPLPIEPWVAAGLSRLWQSMKKNIQETIVSDSAAQPL